MSVFSFLRRLYLLLLSLMFIVVLMVVLLSPGTVMNWIGSISEIALIVRVLLAALFVVGLLALMYVQVRPDRRTNMNGLVMRGSGAVTEVSIESARDRILTAVNAVPDVISAEAQVKPVHGRADVELQVVVLGHDVKLPVKQKEINRALKQVIDKQLGLRMAGQPRIHIRLHDESAVKPSQVAPLAPVPPTILEPVIPPAPSTIPVVSEPEVKPAGGLFSGWRSGAKDESDEDADTLILPEKPVSPLAEREPVTQPSVSPSIDDDQDDDEGSMPSISSLLSKSESESPASSDIIDPNDPDKTIELDLDEELASASADDILETDLSETNESSDEDDKDRSPFT